MKKSVVFIAIPLLMIASLASRQIVAQQASTPSPMQKPVIPDTFTNLKVLPQTISKPDLMKIMKQFSIMMKTRCSTCHAVSDDLSQGSFASDDKPAKDEARKLIQYLQQTATPSKP